MSPQPPPITTYDAFLAAAIKRSWRAPGTSKRTFLALLLATEEAWRVAWDETKEVGIAKPLVAGAASVATAAVALRFLASGPLGVLLLGVSATSLAVLYVAERDTIRADAESVKRIVDTYREEFEGLLDERRSRHIRDGQWELMMDGLMGRLLDELPDARGRAFDPAAAGGFAEHMPAPSLRPPR